MPFGLSAWGIVALAVAAVIIVVQRTRRPQGHGKYVSNTANSSEKDALAACPMSSVEPLTTFDWKATKPLSLRPFKPVYHITMAVQNSKPADLIVMDHNYKDRVLERRQLMAQQLNIVLGAIPSGKAAVEELYSFLLSDYLPRRFPTMFSLSEDGQTFFNRTTGAASPTTPPEDSTESLRILGETVEDDMFLLHETDQGHRSVAYVCCYCSGFDPSQKLDKLLFEIHKPVPSYEKIGPSMERYFKKLEVGKNVKRVNWSVVDSPILFNCKSNHVLEEDLDHIIKDEDIDLSQTHLYTLEEIKSEGLGPPLAEAIEGLGKGNAPGMWQYKGALPVFIRVHYRTITMGRVKTGKAHAHPVNITAGLSVRARRKAGNARAAYQKRIREVLKGIGNLPIDPLERLDVLIPRAGLARTSWPMWVSSPERAHVLCQALQKQGPNARDVTPVLMDLLDHVERHFITPCHGCSNPPLGARCWEHIIKVSSLPSDMPAIIVRDLVESLDAAHVRFIRKRHRRIAKKRARANVGNGSAVAAALDQSAEQMMPKSPFAKKLVRVHALLHSPWAEPRPHKLIEGNGDGNEEADMHQDEDQGMEIDEDEEGYDLRGDDDDKNSSENGSFTFQGDWEDDERDLGDHDLLGASARPIADFSPKSKARQPFGDLAQLLSSAPSAGEKIDVSQVDFQGPTSRLAFGPPAQ
ncbi:hypothetical protein KVR01_013342 [Diaporthe batatas]|uniref:uncharacterized protein n=1 Tax=Diaporthe batatas TaxID=748121 RepID=UPI001D03ADA9|nr:uncharacterized protein KVR01_013342 [Diaporthe batatas]KAG8156737.1 hypothetical protein KVR01_013342 [Diaporthe batatas]